MDHRVVSQTLRNGLLRFRLLIELSVGGSSSLELFKYGAECISLDLCPCEDFCVLANGVDIIQNHDLLLGFILSLVVSPGGIHQLI